MALNLIHGLFIIIATIISPIVNAGDPDITSDFVFPANSNVVNASFFTFTGMRPVVSSPPPDTFTVTKASMVEFPALNGQSVSYAVLTFPPWSVNPPHTHPRSAELLFLIEGSLSVGFVDTSNKLYTQTLQPGDMFVFPKGLVHFQFSNIKATTIAFSAFGSANPGTISLPKTLFTTGIDDTILATSFKTTINTIQMIKAGLSPKA